ncbi:ABC transporter permease subunit [Leucobacter allii]|uniref:ABC transporter permease n=1 Tax=Leucobacter allii TaxID=2932247 RepID=UPI001FD3AA4D|nr:ABC transporter permease subunit [Leucobacter allii]UOR00875.1 ABC transporter permease subunit [Leucobacter allii]
MTATLTRSIRLAAASGGAETSRRRAARRAAWSAIAWQVVGVAVFLGAWELIARQIDYVAILPSPSAVVANFHASMFDDPGLKYLGVKQPGYLLNIGYTVGVAVGAWALGSFLGVLVGLLGARLQLVRNLSEPLLFVFGAVPVLVLAPFFLVWFGNGVGNKFVLVTFYAFITVAMVAQSAALALPKATEEYAAGLGIGRFGRFWAVVLPGTLPAVLSGLRLALSTAIAVTATVELLGSESGAGRLIALRATQANVAAVLALAIAVGLVAILLDLILRAVIRSLLRWQ